MICACVCARARACVCVSCGKGVRRIQYCDYIYLFLLGSMHTCVLILYSAVCSLLLVKYGAIEMTGSSSSSSSNSSSSSSCSSSYLHIHLPVCMPTDTHTVLLCLHTNMPACLSACLCSPAYANI